MFGEKMSDNKTIEKDIAQIKTIPAAKTLIETGLLFEINRRVLHPFGLALVVSIDNETKEQTLSQVLLDSRDDIEGLEFDKEALISGTEKFGRFMDNEGREKYIARLKKFGYVIQNVLDEEEE